MTHLYIYILYYCNFKIFHYIMFNNKTYCIISKYIKTNNHKYFFYNKAFFYKKAIKPPTKNKYIISKHINHYFNLAFIFFITLFFSLFIIIGFSRFIIFLNTITDNSFIFNKFTGSLLFGLYIIFVLLIAEKNIYKIKYLHNKGTWYILKRYSGEIIANIIPYQKDISYNPTDENNTSDILITQEVLNEIYKIK